MTGTPRTAYPLLKYIFKPINVVKNLPILSEEATDPKIDLNPYPDKYNICRVLLIAASAALNFAKNNYSDY